MAGIDIRHDHSQPMDKTRKVVEDMAKRLAERFDMECAWDGDRLNFKRSGIDGSIDIAPKQVRVTVKLGFLLLAAQGAVESEIRRALVDKLS
ncbi:MAG: polyhydroxyalkanoic acid system family protein [Luteimonas sp.]